MDGTIRHRVDQLIRCFSSDPGTYCNVLMVPFDSPPLHSGRRMIRGPGVDSSLVKFSGVFFLKLVEYNGPRDLGSDFTASVESSITDHGRAGGVSSCLHP